MFLPCHVHTGGSVIDNVLALDVLLRVLAANEALDVEDGVLGVASGLVLCGITDQPFVVGKSHVGGCDTVTLVVDEAVVRAWLARRPWQG